jgi:hypothetical protein
MCPVVVKGLAENLPDAYFRAYFYFPMTSHCLHPNNKGTKNENGLHLIPGYFRYSVIFNLFQDYSMLFETFKVVK